MSTMTEKEYNNYLISLQEKYNPTRDTTYVYPRGANNIYEVDWNKRKIQAPEFLSVEKDHKAEVVYFKMDRYFESVDLSNFSGIIQFINARGEGFFYPILDYDIKTYADDNKMVIAWHITDNVAVEAGTVSYSIRFYKIEHEIINGEKKYYFSYNLSTQTSKSKILHGLITSDGLITTENGEIVSYNDDSLSGILDAVEQMRDVVDKATKGIYWIDV